MWVLIEHRNGEIEEASLEVLSETRRLAQKARCQVSALVFGDSGETFAESLAQRGADNIYAVEHDLLAQYTTDGYTTALQQLIDEHRPQTLFLAASALGRDLAPRLATRLRASLVSDCRVVEVNAQGELEMTRAGCGSRVYLTLKGKQGATQIVTVRPGVLGVGKPLKGRKPNLEPLSVNLGAEQIRTRVLGVSKVDREQLDISEAEVVLAFGRGLGNSSLVPQMQELARLLDASLAGSRASVDERWLTFDRQIGQTGKIISPKVIVCCGISGAQQFSMGMQESQFIVAINKDKTAPIFKLADVSVKGDLQEVIPEWVEQLRAQAAG
ncbi:electron transfer flavoprotein subunit alpha/FixB family protein [Malonomonas rubra]|uniref:electron transfer flavoprotein subunit alpha/FixB family protein n=1 Tax=Malonomonas rubra TaxID=57040 RepID=UPI0026E9A108|nr:electron transfer flavoprotein subunit alpha/FixB family protein [Malonomonas rubra]